MDFKQVIPLIIDRFRTKHVHYALIGGFAMAALGFSRNTQDVDFLVDRDDLPTVDAILRELGYKRVFHNENVSQYVSGVKIFGEIDILHAFREISKSMLSRAREIPILEGEASVMVLTPEDIIGLKIQSLANNPEREARDSADIVDILSLFGKRLDWRRIEEYFSLFNRQDMLQRYRDTYDRAH